MNDQPTVPVWDILIRIFHWSLVASFTIAYLTSEEENPWHIYAGYAVLGLIVFRIIWGVIGSEHARFSDFVRPPAAVFEYLKSLRAGNPQRYLGHNPAGGWMIIAMLAMLLIVTVSGLKLYAVDEGKGPLAVNSIDLTPVSAAHAEDDGDAEENESGKNESGEEFWEEIHEISSNIMLLLIALHVTGVVVSGRLHKENLVKAMLTGKKQQE